MQKSGVFTGDRTTMSDHLYPMESLTITTCSVPSTRSVQCPICFGLGRTERLVELSKPQLDAKGRFVKYVSKKEVCEECQGKGLVNAKFTV